MSTSRRGFLGRLGLGVAAAGAAFVGRPLAAAEVALPKTKPTEILNKVAESVKPRVVDRPDVHSSFDILRIVQSISAWCRQGTPAGNIITHKYESKECRDLGPIMWVRRYACVGMRAMRFHSFEHGVGPVETFGDPQCEGFKAIVRDASTRTSNVMYGPVFILTLENGEQVEMFCGTASLRRFAQDLGHEPYEGWCILSSVKVEAHPFTYYVPKLEKMTHAMGRLYPIGTPAPRFIHPKSPFDKVS